MSMIVRTLYCYPMVMNMGGGLLFDAREADHERCPGGHTIPGVLGGWTCPCPCHRVLISATPPETSQEICPACQRPVGKSDFGAPCTPVDCDYRAGQADA